MKETAMGKIVISENVSLDGLADGKRLLEYVGRITGEAGQVLLDEALATEALLLGRRGYEFFAARWPSRTGEYAGRLNSMPKYVMSSTLADPAWANTTVLHGDAVTEVRKLRQQAEGDIVVYGSIQLARTLMEHDLADELRLTVYPVVAGAGEPLFGKTRDIMPMRLVGTRTISGGVVLLTYQPVRDV
jgi:dihydrofolate reductase